MRTDKDHRALSGDTASSREEVRTGVTTKSPHGCEGVKEGHRERLARPQQAPSFGGGQRASWILHQLLSKPQKPQALPPRRLPVLLPQPELTSKPRRLPGQEAARTAEVSFTGPTQLGEMLGKFPGTVSCLRSQRRS